MTEKPSDPFIQIVDGTLLIMLGLIVTASFAAALLLLLSGQGRFTLDLFLPIGVGVLALIAIQLVRIVRAIEKTRR